MRRRRKRPPLGRAPDRAVRRWDRPWFVVAHFQCRRCWASVVSRQRCRLGARVGAHRRRIAGRSGGSCWPRRAPWHPRRCRGLTRNERRQSFPRTSDAAAPDGERSADPDIQSTAVRRRTNRGAVGRRTAALMTADGTSGGGAVVVGAAQGETRLSGDRRNSPVRSSDPDRCRRADLGHRVRRSRTASKIRSNWTRLTGADRVALRADEVARGRCAGDAAVERDPTALIGFRERLVQAGVVVRLENRFQLRAGWYPTRMTLTGAAGTAGGRRRQSGSRRAARWASVKLHGGSRVGSSSADRRREWRFR